MNPEELSRDEKTRLLNEATGSRPEIVPVRELKVWKQRASRKNVRWYRPAAYFGKLGLDSRDDKYGGGN